MPPEVTKDDIGDIKRDVRDLYEKSNETNKSISNIEVSLARIATVIERLPPVPKQPCEYHEKLRKDFDKHVEEQAREAKKDVDSIKEYALKLVFDVVKWVIIAGLGVYIGKSL